MSKRSNESEAFGTNQILRAFRRTYPESRVLQNVILPLDNFGACPTAEFDVLVVCMAGVYLFEIKGYDEGRIVIDKGPDGMQLWKINKISGPVDIPNPIAQGGRKLRYLRQSIPNCQIRGFVYFTSERITIPADISADVVTTADLNYLPRVLRSDAKRRDRLLTVTTVDDIADSILMLAEGHTMQEHIQNCLATHKKPRSEGHAIH